MLSYCSVDNNSKSDKKEKSSSSSKNGESMDSEESEKKGDEIERRQSVSASDTSDPVRLKCRDLLCNALKTEGIMTYFYI